MFYLGIIIFNFYVRFIGETGVKMRLKPNAVPTQNLPQSSIEFVARRKRISSIKKAPAIMHGHVILSCKK